MLWRRRPNIRRLERNHNVRRLIRALSFRDYWTDQLGRVYDLGAGIRRDAAIALASVPEPDTSERDLDIGAALIRSLTDPSGEVRRAAATALGARAEQRAVAPLTETALAQADSRYEAAQSAAVDALVYMGGPDTATTFVNLVISRRDDLERPRDIFVRMLAEGGADTAQSASAAAVSALMNAEREAQARAAEILIWLGPQSVGPLISAVQNDGACVPAIRALGKLYALAARELFAELLAHHDPLVRQAAATALGEISDPRSAQALIEATGDPDYRVREAAIDALERLGPVATMSTRAPGSEAVPPSAQADGTAWGSSVRPPPLSVHPVPRGGWLGSVLGRRRAY